jgi:starch synthase (maltosyl-transferring)
MAGGRRAPAPSEAPMPPRVVVEAVKPCVDAGRFPIKRTLGEAVVVTADALADGHDEVRALLLFRREDEPAWSEVPMESLGNDRWRGRFEVTELGTHVYTVAGFVDHFRTWRRDLAKKAKAGTAEQVDLLVGAGLVAEAATRARGDDAKALTARARELGQLAPTPDEIARALDEDLARLVDRHPDRSHEARFSPELRVWVDREKARFSAWYEMFPRSSGPRGGHGTFREAEKLLPGIAGMGFDVLYLPPIHPIGRTSRKGRNNAQRAAAGDVGSPWAIGAKEGGHTAVHPQLGTLADFRRFAKKAAESGLEVALDVAFQCTPDHPWVKEHREWFKSRPDGTIQYAENPPKKYEDIYPIDFETKDWRALWQALLGVVLFWADEGVRIFRVDNPHTKPFAFWEWLIAEMRRAHPETIFLAEAFTRPKLMYQLAKLGFSQSYTYFAWRNTKWEITEYLRELTRSEVAEFFRPNFWPNTPDILTEALQHGGRPVFMSRLALAATLSPSYGVYGPVYELLVGTPRHEGSEEYKDSEKYEVHHWDLKPAAAFRDYVARLNRIRRENKALQSNLGLEFHAVDNEELIAYSKRSADGSNVVLVVVNLDPHHTQSGWLDLPLDQLEVASDRPYQMHELLTGARYLWHGSRNFVQVDPHHVPVQVFRLRRKVRTEHDFDYFL